MQTTKIQKRLLGAALVAGLAVGLTTTSSAVVIGNFETGVDGWGTDGGPGGALTYAQTSTMGVTLGSSALEFTVPQGGFWGASSGNLIGEGWRPFLQTATQISYDITLDNASLNGAPGGTPAFNGFAQDNEMYIQIYGNSGGINQFIQESWATAGVSDSSGQSAQWAGVDGSRHMVWDLTKFTYTDGIFGVIDVAQALQFYGAQITDVKFGPTAQVGNGTATVGNAVMYIDNVALNGVPEPSTIAMLLAGGALLVGSTIRRSRLSRS